MRLLAYRNIQSEANVPGDTITSKISYKMAWDRNPRLSIFADKLAVRDFVAERIGPQYLVPIIATYKSVNEIDFRGLPREFVLKVNHGSGGVIVVSETADRYKKLPSHSPTGWARFEVNPDSFEPEDAKFLLSYWMKLNYEWWPGRRPEWAYRNIVRRMFVEEFLPSPPGEFLSEFKAFVFNGRVQMIRVDRGTVQGKSFAHYDREWNFLPVTFIEPGLSPHRSAPAETRPRFLDELINLSEALMRGHDFARVDFLHDSVSLRVGEITNYPTAGNFDYVPESFSVWLGKSWMPSYSHQAKWWKVWLY